MSRADGMRTTLHARLFTALVLTELWFSLAFLVQRIAG